MLWIESTLARERYGIFGLLQIPYVLKLCTQFNIGLPEGYYFIIMC